MRYAFRFLLAALPALLLSACNGVDLPAPAESPSRIVLLGELIAGDTIHIRAAHSQPFASASYTVPGFEQDMQISCGTERAEQALTPYEDDLLFSVYTTLFSNPDRIRDQTEYTVRASKPGLQAAEARVKIPAPFTASVSAAGTSVRNGDSVYAFDIDMSALPPDSRYVIEVLRSPFLIYTTFVFDGNVYDLLQEQQLYDSLIRAGAQVDVFQDTSYVQQTDRQSFFADRSSAENTAPGSTRSYYWFFLKPESGASARLQVFIPVAAARQGSFRHAAFRVRVKSVAPDYYDFLKVYELGTLQPGDARMLSFKPTTATGNVKGGLGVIGGVYLREGTFLY